MGLFSRLPSQPVYNTGAVVQRTGVPADTCRAWERRDGLPKPAPTVGNQRLYSASDVTTIAWPRDQTDAGLTMSQAVALFRKREREPADVVVLKPPPAPPRSREARRERLASEMVDALIGYDAQDALRGLEEALALVPVEEVCLLVLQPVLSEIGQRWERDDISVGVERFASAFVLRRIGALFNLSRPETGRGPIVAACLAGELHEVGLLMTDFFLSRRGYQILYLGPNLPLDDLIAAIRRL